MLPHSKQVVKIPCHRAIDCIEQLLTNPKLSKDDFQFHNEDNPLAAPPDDLDYIGDCCTAAAYLKTYKKMAEEPDRLPNQLPTGVIIYIDGATTGLFKEYTVTAVKISLSIFTQQARVREDTWATLGWIPRVKQAVSRGKELFAKSGHMDAEDMDVILDGEGDQVEDETDQTAGFYDIKAQDFHKMLGVILEDYVKLERTGVLFDFAYNKKLYKDVHFRLFTLFFKADTEEANTLCARYKPGTRNIKQVCRTCHILTTDSDNHLYQVKYKTQTEISQLSEKSKMEQLRAMSQHQVKNATYDLSWHVANDRGIHDACPYEKLHSILLGIFMYCRQIFFYDVGKTAAVAAVINGLSRRYGEIIARQSDRSLPNTNLIGGVLETAKYMANDHRGVLLLLAAVLTSTKGRQLLGTKVKFRKDSKKDDWLLLVITLLQWEAYLCQPTMKKHHVKKMEKKNRYMMWMMKQVARREKRMGLKLYKFHGVLHLSSDILLFGVPMEFDTGCNESHHKATKQGAQRAQKNERKFDIQVATRMYEYRVINLAIQEIEERIHVFDYY